MCKGNIVYNEFKEFKDKETGRKITKLTSEQYISHHPYFYNKMLTKDNKFLLYCSDRDGYRNLYKMNLQDGSAIQLTEGEGIDDFSPCFTSDDNFVIFSKKGKIIELKLENLEETCIYETPLGWKGGGFGLSSDDRFILLSEMKENDVVKATGDWSTFEVQWAKKPNCRLVYIDTFTHSITIPLEEKHCWLGHPQIRPNKPRELLFCHEGPGPLIDARLWLVNVDGTGHRCARLRSKDEMVTTHEYWLPDGSKFAFMHRETSGRTTVRFIDPDTLKEDELMECSHYCHFISNYDNSKMVGDGQPPKDPCLFLVDVKERKEEKLCYHGSSFKSYGNTQDCHPHPSFTSDGKAVIFTSDMEGKPCIYKVEI
jgi:oligogalacturonide lyase